MNRLCFVADGRSPIARQWIRHFVARGDEVHVISTFPCDAPARGLASVHVVPAGLGALAGLAGRGRAGAADGAQWDGVVTQSLRRAKTALLPVAFGWVAPFDVRRYAARVREIMRSVNPDLVHAMRVQYEGVLAAMALERDTTPLVVSTWGSDLELWAARYPLLGRLTRRTLARATALHADCARDLRLAEAWGWNPARPSILLPGNGGVRADLFGPGPADAALLARLGLPAGVPLVVNARGVRSRVRNDAFFHAVPAVLARYPDAVVACVGMQGRPEATRWAEAAGVRAAVRLLPALSPAELGALFRAAVVAVSPSTNDGTPNSLLEAMACGTLPVAGDIASVREWITSGYNGWLVDPSDPAAIAAAIVRALDDPAFRAAAAARNRVIVAERADFARGMARAAAFYAAAAGRPGARYPAAA